VISGSGTNRRKKVFREYELPAGGRVVQFANGDMLLKETDGSSLTLTYTSQTTSPTVTYTSETGQTVQYKENEPIPPNIRTKLSQISEIAKAGTHAPATTQIRSQNYL